MIQPHGGKLIERVLTGAKKEEALEKAKTLPRLKLDRESVSDVENMATGVYSPLEGFLGEKDFRNVLNQMRLADDLPWTIPIVLDVDKATADGFKTGSEILLVNEEDGRSPSSTSRKSTATTRRRCRPKGLRDHRPGPSRASPRSWA